VTHADPRRAFTLLEVVVALTLLAATGLSLIALSAQTLHTLAGTAQRERELRRAVTVLTRVSVLPTSALTELAGRRPMEEFTLRLTMEHERVFAVELLDAAGQRSILRTHLFRSHEVTGETQ
jgi:type II secretory pathway component PulJ